MPASEALRSSLAYRLEPPLTRQKQQCLGQTFDLMDGDEQVVHAGWCRGGLRDADVQETTYYIATDRGLHYSETRKSGMFSKERRAAFLGPAEFQGAFVLSGPQFGTMQFLHLFRQKPAVMDETHSDACLIFGDNMAQLGELSPEKEIEVAANALGLDPGTLRQ